MTGLLACQTAIANVDPRSTATPADLHREQENAKAPAFQALKQVLDDLYAIGRSQRLHAARRSNMAAIMI
jgi:hypothetical protein